MVADEREDVCGSVGVEEGWDVSRVRGAAVESRGTRWEWEMRTGTGTGTGMRGRN